MSERDENGPLAAGDGSPADPDPEPDEPGDREDGQPVDVVQAVADFVKDLVDDGE